MTKQQLIQIAKAGFPDHVKSIINIDDLEFISMGGVYRLYDKSSPILFVLPKESIIAICHHADWVQISTSFRAFNDYAAIKEMQKLKLIK